jgi:cysteine desulfurase
MGVSEDAANSSLRFGLGRFTTAAEVEFAARRVAEEAARLRDTAPTWKIATEA